MEGQGSQGQPPVFKTDANLELPGTVQYLKLPLGVVSVASHL